VHHPEDGPLYELAIPEVANFLAFGVLRLAAGAG
jgi:hypothetical protein